MKDFMVQMLKQSKKRKIRSKGEAFGNFYNVNTVSEQVSKNQVSNQSKKYSDFKERQLQIEDARNQGTKGTGNDIVNQSSEITWLDKVKDISENAKDKVVNSAIAVYEKATEFHFEKRDELNGIHPSYSNVIIDGSQWDKLPAAMSVEHDNGIKAVFDGDTLEPVTNPKYKGTYNYVTPALPPENKWNIIGWGKFAVKGVGHIVTDYIPYVVTGKKMKEIKNK